jgi:hypothetical protein
VLSDIVSYGFDNIRKKWCDIVRLEGGRRKIAQLRVRARAALAAARKRQVRAEGTSRRAANSAVEIHALLWGSFGKEVLCRIFQAIESDGDLENTNIHEARDSTEPSPDNLLATLLGLLEGTGRNRAHAQRIPLLL